MPSQHKHNNLPFRPPADLREWLADYVKRSGRARNAILTDALARYRKAVESGQVDEQQATTTEEPK
jgi:hypothetical protein